MSENELGRATSPYLLQHKDNPVHWRAWSESALAEAKRTDKPILLSIGYAACHWCHVMAHESFEDLDTAALMNDLFVAIKVDREERPDIDEVYMASLHAMGQPGGWPLTMFLTPDGEPFWGGTYFPKEASYGRPGFRTVLQQIADVYHAHPERIRANVETLRNALGNAERATAAGEITLAFVDRYATRLAEVMDTFNGGIRGAPKFPNPALLELLWRAGDRMGEPGFHDLVLLTLRRICAGGIHDHLGGGFARYSVDERWLVPHFEKMLYDNAQLLDLFALAFEHTGEDLFRAAAAGIVTWVRREMRTEGGAFSASLDADSEGVEGKFYVWTKAEIVAVLGAGDADFFCRHYDVGDDGNWTDEHTGLTRSILNRLSAKPATPEDEERLALLRGKLLERRSQRVRPGLDDKILADWNGLMIAALVDAGLALHQPEWIDLARAAFDFVAGSMTRDGGGAARLGHSFRDGRLVWPGMASDYADMMRAALALAEAGTGEDANAAHGPARYLALAGQWAAILEAHHLDREAGVLATAADDSRDVVIRTLSTADEATPNANSVYACALVRMAALTGDHGLRQRADRLIAGVAPRALAEPDRHAALMNALDFRLRGVEILIAGPQPQSLVAAALSVPFLNRTVRALDARSLLPSGDVLAEQVQRTRAQAAAFVCAGERCSLPVTEASEIALRVQEMAAGPR
jgi:uncharacterized protein YyaL (SSP411 family)